jgi:hypothetical protein
MPWIDSSIPFPLTNPYNPFNRSYEKHQQKLSEIKQAIERRKLQKHEILDEEHLERSNRLLNNRLKSHEFRENGNNPITLLNCSFRENI